MMFKYRIYSRIRRKILDKILIFFSPFDLYAGLKSQFLFLKAILGITFTTPLNCLLLKQQSCLNPFKNSSKMKTTIGCVFWPTYRCFVYSLLVKIICWNAKNMILQSIHLLVEIYNCHNNHNYTPISKQVLTSLFHFNLYTGSQFWTKLKFLIDNSAYTRGDLYASIYGNNYDNYWVSDIIC